METSQVKGLCGNFEGTFAKKHAQKIFWREWKKILLKHMKEILN